MKRVRRIRGFTLLEILTALAIVALMIGLMIPAIGTIQTTAKTVKQKSQFHAIELALEAFRSDGEYGDYPPSEYTTLTGGGSDNTGYCGAQKLAEAIVGWDGFGFHPKSQWRSDGTAINVTGKDGTQIAGPISLYHIGTNIANFETADENMKARKGPYMEIEKSNAVKLNSLYPSYPSGPIFGYLEGNSYVLSDMFGTVKNLGTGKRAGMPILYYRADTANKWIFPTQLGTLPWAPNTSQDAIYNVNHSFGFLNVLAPWGGIAHPMSDRKVFYNRIKNPNFPGTAANSFQDARPYRAQTYILLSAGADGMYGSPDDVYNIDENEK